MVLLIMSIQMSMLHYSDWTIQLIASDVSFRTDTQMLLKLVQSHMWTAARMWAGKSCEFKEVSDTFMSIVENLVLEGQLAFCTASLPGKSLSSSDKAGLTDRHFARWTDFRSNGKIVTIQTL